MDPIARWYVRTALLWMVSGFVLGSLLLLDAQLPGSWRRWGQPTHGHMLFVGWFFSFAVGVAYWLLPRQRTPRHPGGYDPRLAFIGWGSLNAGLVLRVICEPLQRSGYDGPLVITGLALASVGHLVAAVIVATQLWRRIIPKPQRAQSTTPAGRAKPDAGASSPPGQSAV